MEEFKPKSPEEMEKKIEATLTLENLDAVTRAYLDNLDGEKLKNMKGKFDDKLDAKETFLTGDDGTNEYDEWKCLGNFFLLNEGFLSRELSGFLRKHGIDVYPGEVAELHIPTQDFKLENLRKGQSRLREYVNSKERNRHRPPLRFVYGITYLPADRFGFRKVKLPPYSPAFNAAKAFLKRMREQVDENLRQAILIQRQQVKDMLNGNRRGKSISEEISKLKRRKATLDKVKDDDIALYYLPVSQLNKF